MTYLPRAWYQSTTRQRGRGALGSASPSADYQVVVRADRNEGAVAVVGIVAHPNLVVHELRGERVGFAALYSRPFAVIVRNRGPAPPTPAASAVCDWRGRSCHSWSCPCCRVEQSGCWCPGCRPDLYQESDADYPDAA